MVIDKAEICMKGGYHARQWTCWCATKGGIYQGVLEDRKADIPIMTRIA